MASIQWTLIQIILYTEVVVLLALLLPWLHPETWQKIFNSTIVQKFKKFTDVFKYSFITIILLLFVDSVREVQRQTAIDEAQEGHRVTATDSVIHKRLFLQQRNLYITGFVILISLVIVRITSLIRYTAEQTQAATNLVAQTQEAEKILNAEAPHEIADVMKRRMEELRETLKTVEHDRDVLKKQAENLQVEYNRVSDRLHEKIGTSESEEA